jgi:hypothetical protein
MRHTRLLLIPLIMLFVLACGLTNGIRQIQQAVTQLPEVLTSAPTAFGAIETLVATAMPSNECPAVPAAGGLGVSFVNTKALLQTTQQFTFTDGSVGGQAVSTATLASAAAGGFSAVSNGFSAQFIGDPCNLSEIKITIPRTDQQNSVDQGIQVVNLVLIGTLPVDVQFSFMSWLSQNYPSVAVAGQVQTTLKSMQFTLQRDQTSMLLDILPAK